MRLDWGPTGAAACAADVYVVVDVLSFSTSVCVAVERGMRVFPYPWRDGRAEAFARDHDAALAVGRLEATKVGAAMVPSLSPASLEACDPVPRLVLPSPNGSTIAATMSASGAVIAVGCLRNADAVADWIMPAVGRGATVAVIAAGERWVEDESLRPALEDHLGAGAILAALGARGLRHRMSPEASAAGDLFETQREVALEHLRECVSGQELIAKGFADDVEIAGALNVAEIVPVLVDGSFTTQ